VIGQQREVVPSIEVKISTQRQVERQGKAKCKVKQRAHNESAPTERLVMQSIHLIGNLTKDPEIKTVRTVNGDKPVCTFRVAVNRIGKAGGVDYFNVTTWEAQATNCHKYLAKGSEVAVQGEIRTSESERDGVRRYFWEILADSFGGVKFLRSPNGATRTSEPSDAPQHAEPDAPSEEPVLAGVGAEADSDIPF